MKRILAKEFLLLVGCAFPLLLTALFVWTRNGWMEHRLSGARTERGDRQRVIDSLRIQAFPIEHKFIDLFDRAYVQSNYQLFLHSPVWCDGLDPLSKYSRPRCARLGLVLQAEDFVMPNAKSRALASMKTVNTVSDLGKLVKRRYPGPYDAMRDAEVGRRVKSKFPMAYRFVQEESGVTEMSFADDLSTHGAYVLDPDTKRKRSLADLLRTDVKAPDGKIISFPEGMSEDEIKKTMRRWYPNDVASSDFMKKEDAEAAAILGQVQAVRELTWEEFSGAIDSGSKDSALQSPSFMAARVLMEDTTGERDIKEACAYLTQRHILNCTPVELFFTLQCKPVEPSAELVQAIENEHNRIVDLVGKEAEFSDSIWSKQNQWAVVKWAAILLLALVYPLRFLVLGTLWAIRTLRA